MIRQVLIVFLRIYTFVFDDVNDIINMCLPLKEKRVKQSVQPNRKIKEEIKGTQ